MARSSHPVNHDQSLVDICIFGPDFSQSPAVCFQLSIGYLDLSHQHLKHSTTKTKLPCSTSLLLCPCFLLGHEDHCPPQEKPGVQSPRFTKPAQAPASGAW